MPSEGGDEPNPYWGLKSSKFLSTRYSLSILKSNKLAECATSVFIFCDHIQGTIIKAYSWISREEFLVVKRSKATGYRGKAVKQATGLNSAGNLNGWEHPGDHVREENSS